MNEERLRLLQSVQKEEVWILDTYAKKFIFSDISIMEWCMENEIKIEVVSRDGTYINSLGVIIPGGKATRADGKPNKYIFYVFSKIKDEEW